MAVLERERRKFHVMVSVGVINEYDFQSSGHMSENVFVMPL